MNSIRFCTATIERGDPFDQAQFGKGIYAFKMDSKNELSHLERVQGLLSKIEWTAICVKVSKLNTKIIYVRTSQLATFLNESVDDVAKQYPYALTTKFYAAKCARKKALLTVSNSENEPTNALNVILILQNIFSHLDIQNLVKSYRVCKRWYIAAKTERLVWKTAMCRSLIQMHCNLDEPLIADAELNSLAEQILKQYPKIYLWHLNKFSHQQILVGERSRQTLDNLENPSSTLLQIDTLDENIKDLIRRSFSIRCGVSLDWMEFRWAIIEYLCDTN